MHFSLTFIIPVFNTAQYLPNLFTSILEQRDCTFQCIFINDGSTDNSLEVLQNFSQQQTDITVLTQKNTGASSARNLGIDFLSKQQQKPDYVFFLDSDDILSPNFSKTISQALKNNKTTSLPDAIIIKDKKFSSETDIAPHKHRQNPFYLTQEETLAFWLQIEQFKRNNHHYGRRVLFRYKNVKSIYFDTQLPVYEDWIYLFEACRSIKNSLIVPEILYFYRMHNTSLVHQKKFQSEQMEYQKYQAIKKYYLNIIQEQKETKNTLYKEKFFIYILIELFSRYKHWRSKYITQENILVIKKERLFISKIEKKYRIKLPIKYKKIYFFCKMPYIIEKQFYNISRFFR